MKHAVKFTQNNLNNIIYDYIKENINAPLIFFKIKDLNYALEIIKFMYPYKSNDIIIEEKEYVKICLDTFPYLTNNNHKKNSYVKHNNLDYFLQSDNSNFVLCEKYYIIIVK